MSQVAVDPVGRGQGWGSNLQARVLKNYQHLPLVAHVGVFTGEDLVGWDGNLNHLIARKNNVASHRFHQKHGYVPVAWTSDLPIGALNSGLPEANGHDGVLGVLYVNFREGREASNLPYIDPVREVLNHPIAVDDKDNSVWCNAIPSTWPDVECDLGCNEGNFFPAGRALRQFYANRHNAELSELRSGTRP